MAELVAGAVRIFHCAARTGHVASMRDPFGDLDANARGGLSLLEACRRSAPSSVIIVAGTRQVYGRPRRLPVPESHRIAPPDVNGVHMHAVEQYCALYRSVYGLRSIVARLTNVYGPGMRITDARQMFLGIWIRRVLENGEIDVYGDGTQIRDLMFVDDAARALIKLSSEPRAIGQTVNVGTGFGVQLLDVAATLIRCAGSGNLRFRPFEPDQLAIDIGDYIADCTKLRDMQCEGVTTPLEDGLRLTVEYYRKHISEYIQWSA
jgi:UDP-glucose 4-epimerase